MSLVRVSQSQLLQSAVLIIWLWMIAAGLKQGMSFSRPHLQIYPWTLAAYDVAQILLLLPPPQLAKLSHAAGQHEDGRQIT